MGSSGRILGEPLSGAAAVGASRGVSKPGDIRSRVAARKVPAPKPSTASSPREVMMNPTPTNGRKVTSDRSGQWLTACPRSYRGSKYQVTSATTPISMAKA